MSKIEWTEKTWNPTLGCTEVSPGCTHCYAAKMAYRLSHIPAMKKDYAGLTKKLPNGKVVWTGEVRMLPERLIEPLQTKKATTWFVDSMSDLFHPSVPFDFIDMVFAVMGLCPQHTFQVLTKRPERMLQYFSFKSRKEQIEDAAAIVIANNKELLMEMEVFEIETIKEKVPSGKLLPHLIKAGWEFSSIPEGVGEEYCGDDTEAPYEGQWPFPNVWLGISTENQKELEERIKPFFYIEAAVKFLSCEPLLGPLDLVLSAAVETAPNTKMLHTIDWVICGGESGPGARPMHPDWALSLMYQCRAAAVPFFFKQWGEYLPKCQSDHLTDFLYNSETLIRKFPSPNNPNKQNSYFKLGKKQGGRLLNGVEYNEMPGFYKSTEAEQF